jgi:hypothetical protein
MVIKSVFVLASFLLLELPRSAKRTAIWYWILAMPSKPGRIKIGGDTYVATVMKINSKYPDGTPKELTLIRDEDTVKLSEGDEFTIPYFLKSMKTD